MRSHHLITAAAILGGALTALAVPAVWRASVETSRPVPAVIDAFQGETVWIEPTIYSYGEAVNVSNAVLSLYWQTNGMGAAWWSKSAEAVHSVTGRIRAVWSPTNDVGASQYTYYIKASGSDGASYRAHGILRLRASPGYAPTAQPAPAYAWVSPAEMQAVSNALAAAIQEAGSGDANAVRAEFLATNVQVQASLAIRPDAAAVAGMIAAADISADEALRLIQADSNAWISVEGGVPLLYTVAAVVDSNTIVVASSSGDPYVGPAADALWIWDPTDGRWEEPVPGVSWIQDGPGFYVNPVTEWIFDPPAPSASLPAAYTADETTPARGIVTLDWRRYTLTNATPIATAADIAAATNHFYRTYLLNSNAWMTVSNDTLTIYAPTGGTAAAQQVWQSGEAGIDPTATNLLWQALAAGLAGKADTSWGKYAPDGSANPDPAYMTFLNAPALMHAAGFQWASSGAYSVLSATGAVAYVAGEGGEARWGLDLSSNYVGFVRGGSVTVGAIASSFATQWPGTPTGTVSIAYAYESGDFPSLWYTPALSLPFDAVEGVWVDNTNGTATVTAAATAATGFWQATTSRSIESVFVAKPPARFDGGVFGATNALPVVYDSTITVTSGGKTYRIPAQEVP